NSVSRQTSDLSTLDRCSRTRGASTTSTAAMLSNRDFSPGCSVSSSTRSMENLTAAAPQGSPLWNVTPGRSRTSSVVSSSTVHDSAKCGTMVPSQSAMTRLSNNASMTAKPDG